METISLGHINQVNQTNTEYENNSCIHSKLEFYASVTPEATALLYSNQTVSYRELNHLSNALANHLILQGVQPEDFILVCLDRSIELMVSIFGILKSGGVYVPISPSDPEVRKNLIVEDTFPKLIITTRNLSQTFNSTIPKLFMDEFLQNNDKSSENPMVNLKPTNLAYVIYTSGTTGKPKGALIEHHSVMNRIGWMQKAYPIDSNDVLIQKTSIAFDVSIWELFWWSFAGAKLLLLEQGEEKDPKRILKQVDTHKVSVIHFVPSMLNSFISYIKSIKDKNGLANLKYIFCSGEALSLQSVNALYQELKSVYSYASIINLYGPTEATVDVSHYLCSDKEVNTIPIGKPIDNTQLFVIDENNKILPINEKGELVIGGANLARGYLKREELTQKKFDYIDVFGKKTRVYRTGDIAYWNENCDLIFVGRNDNQIKLRGYRIELGEIEHKLRSHPAINDCTLLMQNTNKIDAAILGFYVLNPFSNVNEEQLKSYLKRYLPDYMIPSFLYKMDSLPVTNNGKLDKEALLKRIQSDQEEQIPENSCDTEQIVSEIWCQLLNKTDININRNFFDVGGNSLLVVQMSILLNENFDIDINVMDLFVHSTIKSIATFINEKTAN